jgi:hypothetical protein
LKRAVLFITLMTQLKKNLQQPVSKTDAVPLSYCTGNYFAAIYVSSVVLMLFIIIILVLKCMILANPKIVVSFLRRNSSLHKITDSSTRDTLFD